MRMLLSVEDFYQIVGTCPACGSEVGHYLSNSSLRSVRAAAADFDYWAACEDDECARHHGEGFYSGEDLPAWIVRPGRVTRHGREELPRLSVDEWCAQHRALAVPADWVDGVRPEWQRIEGPLIDLGEPCAFCQGQANTWWADCTCKLVSLMKVRASPFPLSRVALFTPTALGDSGAFFWQQWSRELKNIRSTLYLWDADDL